MPSINMIAARRAEKLKMEKGVRGTILGILTEIAITLGIFSFMVARIIGASLSIDKLDGELQKIEPTVQMINSYEARIKDLGPKLELLADSREATLLWSNILGDLSRSVPADTWINNVTTAVITASSSSDPKSTPESKTVITVQGVALDQQRVGETMLRLGQNPEFEKVDLNYTRNNGSNDMNAVDFDLAATLKLKDSSKKAEASDVKN